MSGKQSKKERKAAREAEREALRKAERQRTIFTIVVIVVVIAIGGVLVWVSLGDGTPEDELAAEEAEDAPSPLEERPIACDGEEPEAAGEDKPTFDEPEQVLEEGVDYRAVVETSCGTVVIDLEEEGAPAAVNSFVFLAQEGFFDGLLIFRNATSIDALQTGSGTNDASWQVGYTLPDELETAQEEGYPPGTVAMANAGPDTAGSQFFFVYGDDFQEAVDDEAIGLEAAYARFGQAVEGLDVLQRIGEIEVEGETPLQRVYLESVTIEEG